MASGSTAPFSGEFVDLENVPSLGMTDDQRQSLNELFQATARNQFENNLAQLNYDGGLFTIYRDQLKIASSSNVNISTLSSGDSKGKTELVEQGGFDVSTASFTDSFDVSVQASTPEGVAFNNNGGKMYVVGDDNNKVFEYSLGTSFDVSTASFTDSFDVSGQEAFPQGVAFSDSGDKMFVAGKQNVSVVEYSLATFFGVSGDFTLKSKDLSKADNGGFSSPPSSAVLSQSADIPTDTEITYTLRDGNGNTATVTQSDVDSVVDTSNFTSTTVEVKVNLSQSTTNNDKTPTSKDVMVHFKE